MRGREEFGDKSLVFVEFEPPSGWTEDPTSHYLLVDLPGIYIYIYIVKQYTCTHFLCISGYFLNVSN